jgi:hypothetical protein
MPIFQCSKCGCIENTAISRYWLTSVGAGATPGLCSQCDPKIGRWHDVFPKESAKGMLIGNDGFLYSQSDVDSGRLEWRILHQGFKIIGKVE